MAFTKNDEAVSPVIGVILMVAITVILAAVIAAFVFGMAGNIQKSKVVAATASEVTNSAGDHIISITYQGGQDSADVEKLIWSINDQTSPSSKTSPSVGFTARGDGTADKNHVVVSAEFTDGATQVVLDTYV
ncbi:MAG: type IV pilin N-terminal domain-containing protein [Methanoregula sp.]